MGSEGFVVLQNFRRRDAIPHGYEVLIAAGCHHVERVETSSGRSAPSLLILIQVKRVIVIAEHIIPVVTIRKVLKQENCKFFITRIFSSD